MPPPALAPFACIWLEFEGTIIEFSFLFRPITKVFHWFLTLTLVFFHALFKVELLPLLFSLYLSAIPPTPPRKLSRSVWSFIFNFAFFCVLFTLPVFITPTAPSLFSWMRDWGCSCSFWGFEWCGMWWDCRIDSFSFEVEWLWESRLHEPWLWFVEQIIFWLLKLFWWPALPVGLWLLYGLFTNFSESRISWTCKFLFFLPWILFL